MEPQDLKESDAALNASTLNPTKVVATGNPTEARGLQDTISHSGATGHTTGVNTLPTSPVLGGGRHKTASEEESSEAESVDTLVQDGASVCSEKSGLTEIGAEWSQLKLNTETGFIKLSSAEKRRFKKALANGLSREKALETAKMNPPSKTESKRTRSEDESPETTKKRPRTTLRTPAKPTFSQAVSSVRLGLVSTDMANRPINAEQMVRLQEAVIDVAIEHAGGSVRPEFEGCIPRTGWLLLVCTNAPTANWVRSNFEHIRKKSALDINLVEEGQFPRTHVVRGYFPQSLSLTSEKVLATIAAQNPLSTEQWKVVQRMTHGQLLHLVIAIDNTSIKKLVELKGRIAYRFGHIKLILKGPTSKDRVVGDQEERETGSVDPTTSICNDDEKQAGEEMATPAPGPSTSRASEQTREGAPKQKVLPRTERPNPARASTGTASADKGKGTKETGPTLPSSPQGKQPKAYVPREGEGKTKGPRRAKAARLVQRSLSKKDT